MKSTIIDKFALCAGLLLAPLASGAALPVAGQDPISLLTTPPVLAEPQSEVTPIPIQGDSKYLSYLSDRPASAWTTFGVSPRDFWSNTALVDGPNPSAPAVTFEPSSTVDDDDDAPTKIKRMDQLPTETVFVDTDKFEVLRKNSNHDENSWRSNRKWALKSMFPPVGELAPQHFQLIVGPIKLSGMQDEETTNKCGKKIIKRTIHRDWDSRPFDIAHQGNRVDFMSRGQSAANWPEQNAQRFGWTGSTRYWDMGPVKEMYDEEKIVILGKKIAKEMGPYNKLTNNCWTFANKLYDEIKEEE